MSGAPDAAAGLRRFAPAELYCCIAKSLAAPGRQALGFGTSLPAEDRQLGSFSLTHWLLVLVIILIVFGAGKLPRVMGDLAKGIKSFKANMKEVDAADESLPEKVTGDDRIPS
jgi:sec-independent protein translocase protein TatA